MKENDEIFEDDVWNVDWDSIARKVKEEIEIIREKRFVIDLKTLFVPLF